MNLDSLLKQIGKDKAHKIPPVEKWNPELSGDIDMVIRADGTWWHEGGQIKRQELVNLFASILRYENNEYFLITPVEKWRLTVDRKSTRLNSSHVRISYAVFCLKKKKKKKK